MLLVAEKEEWNMNIHFSTLVTRAKIRNIDHFRFSLVSDSKSGTSEMKEST